MEKLQPFFVVEGRFSPQLRRIYGDKVRGNEFTVQQTGNGTYEITPKNKVAEVASVLVVLGHNKHRVWTGDYHCIARGFDTGANTLTVDVVEITHDGRTKNVQAPKNSQVNFQMVYRKTKHLT